MSRLWCDQIHVYLAPSRVDWVRLSRGLKPAQTEKVTVPCESIPEQSNWASPLQQIEKLAQHAEKTEMHVTLSNHFVRYIVLPPQTEISSPEEVQSYASFKMREIYGNQMDTWALSISDWDPVDGAICAAINRELLAQLEQITVRFHIKLVEVEPYLASAVDLWRKRFVDKRVYFALIETGRLCVGLWINGAWHNIRNQKILQSVPDELLAILDQEAILSGYKEANEQVYLFSPECPELVLPPDCGWYITPVETSQIPALAHYPSLKRDEMGNECVA